MSRAFGRGLARAIFTIATAALFAAAPLRAQDPVPIDPLFRLDQVSLKVVLSLIDSAQTAGLPTNPLRSKALQGLAHGADGKAIVREVRAVFTNCKRARAIMGPLPGDVVIEAAANALQAGIRPEALAQFTVTKSGRSPAAALTLLTDLVDAKGTKKVPRDDATREFLKLWKLDVSDQSLWGLWSNIGGDIRSGVNPGVALQNQIRLLPPRPPSPESEPPPPDQPDSANL